MINGSCPYSYSEHAKASVTRLQTSTVIGWNGAHFQIEQHAIVKLSHDCASGYAFNGYTTPPSSTHSHHQTREHKDPHNLAAIGGGYEGWVGPLHACSILLGYL